MTSLFDQIIDEIYAPTGEMSIDMFGKLTLDAFNTKPVKIWPSL